MCSFLFSTRKVDNLESTNYFLKFRGPDSTQIRYIENYTFIHNLLSITGEIKNQPIIEDDIILIYNGEIYNFQDFGNFRSDGECIVPLYREFGPVFTKKLDGEFAICLVDLQKNIVVVSSDIFKTKPLFITNEESSFGCSSYTTPLLEIGHKNVVKMEPNKTFVISLSDFKIVEEFYIYQFDLEQKKNTYEDWCLSFEKSIKKRIKNTNKKIFIGLSSGYDSGLIYSELISENINFGSFTLLGNENEDILQQRVGLANRDCNIFLLRKNDEDYEKSNLHIKEKCENFIYTIHSSQGDYEEYISLSQDSGSNNFATICREARKYDYKICLSGTGSDEIISDYGFDGKKFFNHSNFGGFFPEKLESIFPWSSFWGSTMESYIAKEEWVGGSFGIEMRYPFLDRQLVQEFLWLDQKLKNRTYKSVIDYMLTKKNFPFERGIKRGF